MTDTHGSAWSIDARDFPELGTTNEQLTFLLRYALLAPSSHNTQPWRFGLGNGYVELYADRSRALPVVDPQDRELVISCGAALYHLRVAARAFGYEPTIERFPRGPTSDHLATLRLGARVPVGYGERLLFDAIPKRRTSRRAFSDSDLPDELVYSLERAVQEEGAWLRVLVSHGRKELAAIIAEADRMQFADSAFRAELASWMTGNHSKRGDGMPGYAFGQNDLAAIVGPLIVRTFDVGQGRAASDRELTESAAIIGILGTASDEPRAWLATGEALAHMWLRATAADVSLSFLNQPVEVPELRAQLQRDFDLPGAPQLIVRLGYGPEGVPVTPRRRLEETLIT